MLRRLLLASLSATAFAAASASADQVRMLPDEAIFDHLSEDRPSRVIEVASLLDRIGDPKRAERSAKALAMLATWRDELTGFCAERGVNPYLAAAVIVAESNGVVTAESHVGAGGLMQLMPATAAGLSVADRKRAVDNIYGGCRYLGQMLDRHDGDEVLALAAYNAGPGAVARHGGVPPYRETRAYVVRVARAWPERFDGGAASGGSSPAPTTGQSTGSIEFELSPND